MGIVKVPVTIINFMEQLADTYKAGDISTYRNYENTGECYKLLCDRGQVKYERIIAVPPFAGRVNREEVKTSLSNQVETNNVNLLSIRNYLNMLTDTGILVILLPRGFLFKRKASNIALRKQIVNDYNLDTVINIPAGVFEPICGIVTAILVINRVGQTEKVKFFDVKPESFIDNEHMLVETDDLLSIINYLSGNEDTCHQYLTSISVNKIAEKDYSLEVADYL